MGQADLEDQALLRNVRKCRAHPDRGGPHRLPAPAHGPGRPRDCPEPASLRPPRARQPDAQAPTRPAARTRTTAPAQYQSVELQTMLNLNRTAVVSSLPSTVLLVDGHPWMPGTRPRLSGLIFVDRAHDLDSAVF